jgi:hypothetical protein
MCLVMGASSPTLKTTASLACRLRCALSAASACAESGTSRSLELVSKEFAMAVWDNTCTKDILHQDSPELCERIAQTMGTHQVNELTVRRKRGPLMTSLSTGEASSRMVDAYRLHPNAIKGLARCGQGYLLSDSRLRDVAATFREVLARAE